MEQNVAGWDRAVRIVKGGLLLSLTFMGPHTRLGLLGLAPLVTGLLGKCPLYDAMGIDTRDPKEKTKE